MVSVMRRQGWVLGCPNNQETDEYPRLNCLHRASVGDPAAPAWEVRRGLDQRDTVRP